MKSLQPVKGLFGPPPKPYTPTKAEAESIKKINNEMADFRRQHNQYMHRSRESATHAHVGS